MRKIILINCVWAAVAAGAFFIGQKDNAKIQLKRIICSQIQSALQ